MKAWPDYFVVVGIVPGRVVLPGLGLIDLSDTSIPVEVIMKAFMMGCPYLKPTPHGQWLLGEPIPNGAALPTPEPMTAPGYEPMVAPEPRQTTDPYHEAKTQAAKKENKKKKFM